MNKKHTVEIPEHYLLTIAAYGKMGDGELPDLMANWVRKMCNNLGLGSELHKLQDERRAELSRRLRNVLGSDFMDKTEAMIEETVGKLK